MPLDVGVGILLSIIVAHFSGVELSVPFVLFGVGSALLPDIDILPFLWRTAYDHRSVLHAPSIYVPLALVVYMLLGPVFAILFILAVLAHLVHDTFGLGWGIRWAWPLSNRRFLLFPEKGRSDAWHMSWTEAEEKEWAPPADDGAWVRQYYFRPNKVAYIEYGVLLVSIFTLLQYIQ